MSEDVEDFVIYLTSIFVSFCAVFLKGFQHKNVIGNHQRAVVVTSFAMAAFEVASVNLIMRGGWPIAVTIGTGASLGMIAAIRLHDRLFREGGK